MTTGHSPTPWSFGVDKRGTEEIRDAYNKLVHSDEDFYPSGLATEDAKLIVNSVNAVPVLLSRIARLEKTLKLIASGMSGDKVMSDVELSGLAHAALIAGPSSRPQPEPGSLAAQPIGPDDVTDEMRVAVLSEIGRPSAGRIKQTQDTIPERYPELSGWNTMVAGLHVYAKERGIMEKLGW